jgi:hypothetical protein
VGFEVWVGANPGFGASRFTLGYDLTPASAGLGTYVDTVKFDVNLTCDFNAAQV